MRGINKIAPDRLMDSHHSFAGIIAFKLTVDMDFALILFLFASNALRYSSGTDYCRLCASHVGCRPVTVRNSCRIDVNASSVVLATGFVFLSARSCFGRRLTDFSRCRNTDKRVTAMERCPK